MDTVYYREEIQIKISKKETRGAESGRVPNAKLLFLPPHGVGACYPLGVDMWPYA